MAVLQTIQNSVMYVNSIFAGTVAVLGGGMSRGVFLNAGSA
ncbi:MAG TPA: hypothetical protein VFA29_13570 [Candidatus Baltobacteraceae bacterium]|nr:hypothetical protein [Candidatus Baltobacteraceae bacterium]